MASTLVPLLRKKAREPPLPLSLPWRPLYALLESYNHKQRCVVQRPVTLFRVVFCCCFVVVYALVYHFKPL
jgi:hypothetical protein